MTRFIISGCNGKMGNYIAAGIKNRPDCITVAGIDAFAGGAEKEFPVFSSAADISCEADVLIDFSNPALLSSLLELGVSRKLPMVICTTGFSKDQVAQIKKASETIPIFCSGNMSLGVNLMIELAKKAASVLWGQFDVEIIEKHHNLKVDAPSGTALMIADAISSTVDEEPHYEYDRHSQRKKRSKTEIGLHSVRGGTIVGEHEVLFAGPDEILSITHSAQSKEIFATGSINAALFLVGKSAGMYNMGDLLADHKEES
ncbi:MAG: 4-hydroxy-tetrahydrodipicolinate reductase [Clostridium sp.]|uniref:4-hydroxy-tetrahydrodipicolinate reductase n=1 Tax=Clostridium sp. TaxID=1506 RepID=UPI002913759F|nr:4-hydroxy-tetrahydrodipicolinate reductase [Clostridium sp.]MDU7337192.1 4-hydroxy-tetrahydrodipicolinate reductase [Clostridium sp.]